MHGRVKTKTTEEQKEIARQEKYKKAKTYRESMKIILEKRLLSSWDQNVLDLMAGLLTSNPDIITLWNYRREILLNLKNEKDSDSYQKLLDKDLSLTEQCLRVNPKSYGSWHHRVWILDNMPKPEWENELRLCTKYLQLDERNFHCWDYRRIVTQKSNISDESEYKFTSEKIETNFSNYSAWHLRTKLLPKIFPDPKGKFPINEEKHKEELELVENAAFTDPNDQSAWFYLRWLLALTEPKVWLVHVEGRESEIFLVTSRNVKLGDESEIRIKIKINDQMADGVWESKCLPSCFWSFKLKSQIQSADLITVILEEKGVEYSSLQLQRKTVIYNKPNFYPTLSDGLKKILVNQLSSCEQLLALEPDSKWALLTSVFLMLSLNSVQYKTDIIQALDKLSHIDPLRKGYYCDLKSKILVELALDYSFKALRRFILTNQNLTALYHSQYFINFQEVNLSGNDLSSESLNQFYTLINCKVLNLSKNKIESLLGFPVLPKLEVLFLHDNMIKDIDKNWSNRFPKLRFLSLWDNPVVENNR